MANWLWATCGFATALAFPTGWDSDTEGQDFVPLNANIAVVHQGQLHRMGVPRDSHSANALWVARLDEGRWTSLPGRFRGRIHALLDWDGRLIAAGRFAMLGPPMVEDLALWNGANWSPFEVRSGESPRGGIEFASAWDRRTLVVGGNALRLGQGEVCRVASWRRGRWHAIGSSLPFTQSSKLKALASGPGGRIFTVVDEIEPWPHSRLYHHDGGRRWHRLLTGDRIAQLAVSTDGSLYAAGRFLLPQSTAYQTLARWDGKEWAPLPGDLSFPTRRQQGSVGVSAITAWQDGLVVSGGFSHAGALEANRIARWDGTSWHALGEGLGPRMRWGSAAESEDDFTMEYRLWGGAATVLVGGPQRLFVRGGFNRAGSVGVRGLACWDGVHWSDPERAPPMSINGPVWSLASVGTNLVAFGFFTAAGETTAEGWASWTGQAWHALAIPSPQGLAARTPMATDGARLWAFTGSGLPTIHQLVEWNGDAWNPVANTASLVTAVRGNALFFCGDGVMRWDEGELTTVAPRPGSSVAALGFLPDGTLCAVARLARNPHATVCVWTGDDWQTLEGGWTLADGPTVILEDGDALYVAGRFNGSERHQAQRGASTLLFSDPIRLPRGVARWRQGRWEPLGSLGPPQLPFPGRVHGLVAWRGQVFAGGQFQQIGGVAAQNIARWDGQQWHPLGRGVPGPVAALVAHGEHLYVGGHFSRIGQSVSNLARWHWPADLTEPPN